MAFQRVRVLVEGGFHIVGLWGRFDDSNGGAWLTLEAEQPMEKSTKQSLHNISSRTLSSGGMDLASPNRFMPTDSPKSPSDEVIVPISTPGFAPKPIPTRLRAARSRASAKDTKLAELARQVEAMDDKICRLLREIDDEIRFFEKGLHEGQWETYDAVKRRLSRLKGARDYKGQEDGMFKGQEDSIFYGPNRKRD